MRRRRRSPGRRTVSRAPSFARAGGRSSWAGLLAGRERGPHGPAVLAIVVVGRVVDPTFRTGTGDRGDRHGAVLAPAARRAQALAFPAHPIVAAIPPGTRLERSRPAG